MTYKKPVPDFVYNRWKTRNPSYNIEMSLDAECILFLERYMGDHPFGFSCKNFPEISHVRTVKVNNHFVLSNLVILSSLNKLR
jgi:hypothetical protein